MKNCNKFKNKMMKQMKFLKVRIMINHKNSQSRLSSQLKKINKNNNNRFQISLRNSKNCLFQMYNNNRNNKIYNNLNKNYSSNMKTCKI